VDAVSLHLMRSVRFRIGVQGLKKRFPTFFLPGLMVRRYARGRDACGREQACLLFFCLGSHQGTTLCAATQHANSTALSGICWNEDLGVITCTCIRNSIYSVWNGGRQHVGSAIVPTFVRNLRFIFIQTRSNIWDVVVFFRMMSRQASSSGTESHPV
jgi:hypothetical protein